MNDTNPAANQQQSGQAVFEGYNNAQGSAASSAMSAAGNQKQQGAQSAQASIAVAGVFRDRETAEKAVRQLRQQNFTQEEINVITKDKAGNRQNSQGDDIMDGALTGGTIGGIGGLLLGAGALAIPGIGPILAAGPIAAALSGVVAGGIAGGLIDWGIPAEASQRYENSIANGGVLAIVKTTRQKSGQAAAVLRQYGASDVNEHPVA